MPWHLSCTVRVSCPKKDRIHRGQPSLLLIFPLLSHKQKILSMELISALLAWRLFWIFLEKCNIFCLSAKKNPGESTETTLGERHEPVMDASDWHNTSDLLSNSIPSQFLLDLFQFVQRGLYKSYFHSSGECSTSWSLTF